MSLAIQKGSVGRDTAPRTLVVTGAYPWGGPREVATNGAGSCPGMTSTLCERTDRVGKAD